MKALVVDPDNTSSAQAAGWLRENGHQVSVAANLREAIDCLGKGIPHAVFADATLLASHGYALVRRLREQSSHYVFIAQLENQCPDTQLLAAYRAGIDSDLRKPPSREQLLARVCLAERLSGAHDAPHVPENGSAAGTVMGGHINGHAAARPEQSSVTHDKAIAPLDLVARSNAWKQTAESLQSVASQFFSLAVTVEKPLPVLPAAGLGCSISLSNTEQQLEIRIALVAGAAGAKKLSSHLFGADDEELSADMLAELANIFMGSLKASLAAETMPFTGGIAAPIGPELVINPLNVYPHQGAFTLVVSDVNLLVHLGLRSKANIMVPPGALREGMVLAKNVFNARGLLVVNGGTRLSSHMIGNLRSHLGPRQLLEVMAP